MRPSALQSVMQCVKGRLFLPCIFLLTLTAAAEAQTAAAEVDKPAPRLPEWAVLTLQPVSGDRVRPVTGVVISVEGLVVVPLAFAEESNQMIVLDGGTDIIKNGRAAVLKQKFPQLGLAVISAPLLKRPAATFPESPLQAGDTVYLAAYPPAEQISQGMAPLWQSAKLSAEGVAAASSSLRVAGLPNVTGPLVDACGNFAGFSSAEGVQSMDTGKSPAYVWKEGMQRLLAGMGLTLAEAPCPVPVAMDSAAAAANDPAAAISDEASPTEAGSEDTNPIAASGIEEVPAEVAPEGDAGNPGSDNASASGGLARSAPSWLFWLMGAGLLIIVVLAALVFWLHRIRKTVQAPSLLQDTTLEGRGRGGLASDQDDLPADCVLEINGRMSNGSPFTQRCEVSAAAVNAVIGRGPVDLIIDSQAVHREHARLGGSADLLTISDLGSPRGTWINRVPCLKGEIMFITPEDTIFLGDVSFQVALRPRQPGTSTAGKAATEMKP